MTEHEKAIHRLKLKIAYHKAHYSSVETIFSYRMELMPWNRTNILQHIFNEKKVCDNKVARLEKELETLREAKNAK